VDGGWNADGEKDLSHLRKAGFESFRYTLRRTVRVPKVIVYNLSSSRLTRRMKMEMMGLDTSKGSPDWKRMLGPGQLERSYPRESEWDSDESDIDVEEWYEL